MRPQPRHRGYRWSRFVRASLVVLLVVIATAGAVALARGGGSTPHSTSATAPEPEPTSDGPGPSAGSDSTGRQCTYLTVTETVPVERKPPQPAATPSVSATVSVTLDTTMGTIVLDLDADKAPCTVNSFVNLARNGFYTSTACHRLSTQDIFVLQCGDPSASGLGGPSYRFADENLPVDAHPPYPRGTVAMVNAGLESNGSQFFLVYKDSDISATYPVFGTISKGLDVLDKIAAAGSDNSLSTGDGRPKLDVAITKVTVAGVPNASGAPGADNSGSPGAGNPSGDPGNPTPVDTEDATDTGPPGVG